MQLLVELSARKTYLSDFNTKGNLEAQITNTWFCEQLNSYNGDKDFNKFLLNLMVRLQFHTSSLLLLPGPLWARVVVPVGLPSLGKMDLFENY